MLMYGIGFEPEGIHQASLTKNQAEDCGLPVGIVRIIVLAGLCE
jgi:hypothetical protein